MIQCKDTKYIYYFLITKYIFSPFMHDDKITKNKTSLNNIHPPCIYINTLYIIIYYTLYYRIH